MSYFFGPSLSLIYRVAATLYMRLGEAHHLQMHLKVYKTCTDHMQSAADFEEFDGLDAVTSLN